MITIIIKAVKIVSLITPMLLPIPANINVTSPLGIMAMPIAIRFRPFSNAHKPQTCLPIMAARVIASDTVKTRISKNSSNFICIPIKRKNIGTKTKDAGRIISCMPCSPPFKSLKRTSLKISPAAKAPTMVARPIRFAI